MDTGGKRTLHGNFYVAANSHRTYEIFDAVPDILFEVSNILVARFGCTQPDMPIIGLDVVITQCRKENIELDLGWDNWSGFYILANSPEGDELVQEIGTYLDTVISGKDFEKYVQYR